MNETYPFNSEETDGMGQREQLEEYFSQSLEVELLLRLCPDDEDTDLKNGKFGGTFIAKCDYKNTDLAKLIKTDTNINSHNMNSWSDVGVVVRTDNGQTYIAISAVFKFKT